MIQVRKILCSLFFFLFIFTGTNFASDDIGINGTHVRTQEKRLQEIQEELKRKRAGEAAVRKQEKSILDALSRIERRLLAKREELRGLDSR